METLPRADRLTGMMTLALALVLFLQDPSIDESVKALSDPDPAVRAAAAERLRKTPYDKLELLEPHLKHADAGVRRAVASSMEEVIAPQFGRRKARFEWRPLATVEVMKKWVADKADPDKPPAGHEAVRAPWKADALVAGEDIYNRNWVLVEAPCATEADVDSAGVEPNFGVPGKDGPMSWLVTFKLTPDGAARFDEAAARLFRRKPRGRLVVLMDGRVVVAPLVNAEKFHGAGVIQGQSNQAECQKFAQIMTGEWLTSVADFVRMDKGKVGGADFVELIRPIKGLSETTIKEAGSTLEIRGPIDLREAGLIPLWQTLREHGYRLAAKK